MGFFAKVEVTGLDQFKAKLEALDKGLREQALRSAGYAGAKIIQDEAILNAPYMTGPTWRGHPPAGTLKNSIIVKRVVDECRDYLQSYIITVRRGPHGGNTDAYYAHFVEYGHIYRQAGQRLTGGKSAKAAKRAAHIALGGTTVPAHPYMRPAYETKKGEAETAIKQKIIEFLTKIGS